MGWQGFFIRISVLLDAHAAAKEVEQELLYEKFLEELRVLCQKYPEIRAEITRQG